MGAKPFQEGYFDYNECFFGEGGFLSPDANEEKHMMSLYSQVLAEALAKYGVVFGGDQPIHWLEPGIGEGSSTIKFMKAIGHVHKAGFIVHGSDYQKDSVHLAYKHLSRLQEIKITVAEIIVKDAFCGEPLASEKCDFAMLSHFVYHLKSLLDGRQITPQEGEKKMTLLLKSVMASLREHGLALAFHEGPQLDMFGKIGQQYGMAMNDAPDRIARAAIANGKTIVGMPLESKLYFPDLPSDSLDSLKVLENWSNVQEGTPEASWVKKLLFALHNTPVKDGSHYVNEGGVRDLAKEPGKNRNTTRL